MRLSTFFYCVREGMKNIWKNIWFSLASTAIISACIFLFCMFFALAANVDYMVKNAEKNVGITVFFEEDLTEEEILAVGGELEARPEIADFRYISAGEAWETFREEYLEGDEELAAGFEDDNPLAGSASYEIFLKNIEDQKETVDWLEALPGVRKVNYLNETVAGLSSFNRILSMISMVIIGILLAVAIFLNSNTIMTAAAFRKEENRIMRLIGATNFMIRMPFMVEGTVIGLVGALIPLCSVYFLYSRGTAYVTERFHIISDLFEFIPIGTIFPYMVAAALLLGVGIGLVGSFITIRRHLKV